MMKCLFLLNRPEPIYYSFNSSHLSLLLSHCGDLCFPHFAPFRLQRYKFMQTPALMLPLMGLNNETENLVVTSLPLPK